MIDAVQNIIAFPFFAMGWLIGNGVRGLVWLKDAIILGYMDGRHGHSG